MLPSTRYGIEKHTRLIRAPLRGIRCFGYRRLIPILETGDSSCANLCPSLCYPDLRISAEK